MSAETIKNLDALAYQSAIDQHCNWQTGWVRLGYAPRNFYLKDFCLIEVDGLYHLFHIAGTPGASCVLPGNEIWFGHAVTRDFRTWQTLASCLYIDPDSPWDNGHIFAPYVIRQGGRFVMFYTGTTIDNTQRIGVAYSEDLMHWKRGDNNPILRPDQFEWVFCPVSGGAACRDPHVTQFGDEYYLYYTAVTKDGSGCVALACSRDLIRWEDRGPVFVLSQGGHCESSNVQKVEDKYLLFFGGHGKDWSYVISDRPDRWLPQPQRSLGQGITAMEVIRKQGDAWLVAFFRQNIQPFHDGCRLFLGIIDWSVKQPRIEQLSEPGQLDGWFEPCGMAKEEN